MTRRLTQAWEFSDRRLWVYDFRSGALSKASSKSLLTSSIAFGDDVEESLNQAVEGSLADYLTGATGGAALQTTLPWPQERAANLSLMLQSLRTAAARGDSQALVELRAAVCRPASSWDNLVFASRRKWRLLGGRLEAATLCFPSSGSAAFPMNDGRMALFQPTSPMTFVAHVPVDAADKAAGWIRQSMANGLLTACSVGVNCDKVVVPETYFEERSSSTLMARVAAQLESFREQARRATNVSSEVENTPF